MDVIFIIFSKVPMIATSFLLFAISSILYFILYVYINVNYKGIFKIMFPEKKIYKRPLEPFNFFFVSMLPTTFWREILNIKYNKSFKKIYGKEFYYPINKEQLINLLRKYPLFFLIQYLGFFAGLTSMLLIIYAYISDRYF
ncbi:hypothetical protein [Acinetobacter sp. ESBL14]|uniref:hypothetical protein n=1 Tax=Acinetobacter sp. ESBL14 TaxID=3077329 RepID=UPI002FC7439F